MAEIEPKNSTEKTYPLQIKEELELLNYLKNQGAWWAIQEEYFPNIPVDRVARDRFLALDNDISAWQYARKLAGVTGNQELESQVAARMTSLIKDGQTRLAQVLGITSTEIDPHLIANQFVFRQTMEASRQLGIALSFGLYEQINEFNFPALTTLEPEELGILRISSILNLITNLESARSRLRSSVGFNLEKKSGTDQSIEQMIEKATQALSMELKVVDSEKP
jgi:hypothetical protein